MSLISRCAVNAEDSRSESQTEFARLFEACQHDLLRYILGCIPSHSDALDILQETATALWLKFADFDPTQPFGPWARKFAHIQVLKFCLYRKRAKAQFAMFSESTVTALDREFTEHEQVLAARNDALAGCIEKLSTADRMLLRQRYVESATLRQVAADQGVGEDQLYRRLHRIRKGLMKCVDHSLAKGGL
jgi:RNA polymerase sigma-70 factor (ECF subfamily)